MGAKPPAAKDAKQKWQEIRDPQGDVYFHDPVSGQSVWSLPDKAWCPIRVQTTQAVTGQAEFSSTYTVRPRAEGINAEDWERHWCKDKDRYYFHNKQLRESIWVDSKA